jgi:hypothetical protein
VVSIEDALWFSATNVWPMPVFNVAGVGVDQYLYELNAYYLAIVLTSIFFDLHLAQSDLRF